MRSIVIITPDGAGQYYQFFSNIKACFMISNSKGVYFIDKLDQQSATF